MFKKDFLKSVEKKSPLKNTSEPLKALWYEATGQWDQAHRTVQPLPDDKGAAIHAYLHRKEGNMSNARYWYSRLGIQPSEDSLEKEWEMLVDRFTDKA